MSNLLHVVNDFLRYDPCTGQFYWIKTNRSKAKPGDVAGGKHSCGYVRITLLGKQHLAHRLAFLVMQGSLPVDQVDHINGIRSDNRWNNLRLASSLQNSWNQHLSARNTSGFKGASFITQHGKFAARIRVNGKRKFLGYFDTAEAASKAYAEAATKYFGSFACY